MRYVYFWLATGPGPPITQWKIFMEVQILSIGPNCVMGLRVLRGPGLDLEPGKLYFEAQLLP